MPSPASSRRPFKSAAIEACAEASRPLMGSSATRNDGFAASARPIAIRCRCPPENSCGNLAAALRGMPIRSRISSTRAPIAPRGAIAARTPSAIWGPILRRGFSEE
jgi:hypothetical protein